MGDTITPGALYDTQGGITGGDVRYLQLPCVFTVGYNNLGGERDWPWFIPP